MYVLLHANDSYCHTSLLAHSHWARPANRLLRKLDELGHLAEQAEAELAATDSKQGMLARAMASGLVVGRWALLCLMGWSHLLGPSGRGMPLGPA